MSDYKPDWQMFIEESLKKNKEITEEEKIPNKCYYAKEGYEIFWDRINKLIEQGKKCRCDNDEEGWIGCTKCFLDKDNESIPAKWEWSEPRGKNKRWLCYSRKLYCDAIHFKDK